MTRYDIVMESIVTRNHMAMLLCSVFCLLLLVLNYAAGSLDVITELSGSGKLAEQQLRFLGLATFVPLITWYAGLAICWIVKRVERELAQLHQTFNILEQPISCETADFLSLPRFFYWRTLAMALLFFLLSVAIDGTWREFPQLTVAARRQFALILVDVLCMWLVVSLATSLTFYHLRRLKVLASGPIRLNLLHIDGLLPFSRIGVCYSLLWSGSLALTPLFYLYGQFEPMNMVLALILIGMMMVLSVVLPLLPARLLIIALKQRELAALSQALRGDKTALANTHVRADAGRMLITDILQYQSQVEAITEWPVNVPVLQKLGLYLVLPVLSWAGASVLDFYVKLLI